MDDTSDFDHEWDIKLPNGMNVTENKLYEAMLNIGLKPEPQYKISRMTVDFAFTRDNLVIEVNGPYHQTEEQKMKDKKKWFVLKLEGWKRKTYSADSVYKDPHKIALKIAHLVDFEPIIFPKEDKGLDWSNPFEGRDTTPIEKKPVEMELKRGITKTIWDIVWNGRL